MENMPMPSDGRMASMAMPRTPSDGKMDMPMPMTFYWSQRVTLLFNGWATGSSVLLYLITLAAVFLLAFLHQFLARLQKQLVISSSRSNSEAESNKLPPAPAASARTFALQTVLYAVYSALSYLLMLMVMSYNVGVFLAVIVGATAGFLAFHRQVTGAPQDQQVACA